MLQSFQIGLVVDIRRFPGSKRYPHYNKDALQASLSENKIEYTHIEKLGDAESLLAILITMPGGLKHLEDMLIIWKQTTFTRQLKNWNY